MGTKVIFSKKINIDHWGCQSNWFEPSLSLFGLVMARQKVSKSPEDGPLVTKNWSKMSLKHVFPKNDLRPLGMLKQVN